LPVQDDQTGFPFRCGQPVYRAFANLSEQTTIFRQVNELINGWSWEYDMGDKKDYFQSGSETFFSRSRRAQMTGRNNVSLHLNALRYD
jgi:hypothetical protein